jgi:hypothetical protein
MLVSSRTDPLTDRRTDGKLIFKVGFIHPIWKICNFAKVSPEQIHSGDANDSRVSTNILSGPRVAPSLGLLGLGVGLGLKLGLGLELRLRLRLRLGLKLGLRLRLRLRWTVMLVSTRISCPRCRNSL